MGEISPNFHLRSQLTGPKYLIFRNGVADKLPNGLPRFYGINVAWGIIGQMSDYEWFTTKAQIVPIRKFGVIR